jgi:hypothetical protein
MQMLKYFGMLVTIRISSTRKFKSRLNSGNVRFHSVHNLCFPPSNIKIQKLKYINCNFACDFIWV